MDPLGQLININPLLSAHKITSECERRDGLAFFTLKEEKGPAIRIDPDKIDQIVHMACESASQDKFCLPIRNDDVVRCKRYLRRRIIRRIAFGLIEAGF